MSTAQPPATASAVLAQIVSRHSAPPTNEIRCDGNGHGYFRQSPWASSDILATLAYDLQPADRGLVRATDSPIWTFPTDYIERLRTTRCS